MEQTWVGSIGPGLITQQGGSALALSLSAGTLAARLEWRLPVVILAPHPDRPPEQRTGLRGSAPKRQAMKEAC